MRDRKFERRGWREASSRNRQAFIRELEASLGRSATWRDIRKELKKHVNTLASD